MPAISLPNFKITQATLAKPPRAMVEEAFNELTQWFAGLVNPIEDQYQRGTDTATRTDTMFRLSKMAGQVSGMKDLIEGYVNVDLNPKPNIQLPDYDLPDDATTLNDAKTPPGKRLPPKYMTAAAFQALTPWFKTLFPRIKPYYLKGLNDGDESTNTKIRLAGLVRQVNTMKVLLLGFVNEEIEKKEKGTSLSAGDENGVEAVPIPADVGVEVVQEILDVKISNEPLPAVDENPDFQLGGDEEE